MLCVCMIRFLDLELMFATERVMYCATKGINMIEQYGRYRLKRIHGWEINDNREFLVIGFYSANTVLCESPCGELYVFLKEFLIDPENPDDIYSNITIKKVNDD